MNKTVSIIIAALVLYSANLFAGDASSITYSSVSDAFEKLKANPSATTRQEQDWIIISHEENGSLVLWYFPPEKNAVHQAVFKKTISPKGKGIETRIISFCEASKSECAEAAQKFADFNQ